MARAGIVERLGQLPTLRRLPHEELDWLVARGQVEVREAGVLMAPGEELEHLFIVLSGSVVVRVDRGVGPRRVIEWSAGHVTGMLPFSRVDKVRNDVLSEGRTELLSIHRRHFPEMVHKCPAFTELTVHSMLDRARRFNASDLQDEKMISLGRLAAGLAHELNNPASATKRGTKLLRTGLPHAEKVSRELGRAGLSEDLITSIERLSAAWTSQSDAAPEFDREDELEEWLVDRGLDPAHASPLTEASATVEGLNELAELVPTTELDAVVRWIAVASTNQLLARDVEEAATRIHELVAAVKRFSYMDRVAGSDAVDVESGLRDTIEVMAARADTRGATLALEAEPNLPPVQALGSDLNQVWMSLLENAIDAVEESGRIEVRVRNDLDRVAVRVIDNGPGIEPDILPRIFDPFFTTKPPGQGIGLGLEITRQLLKRHDGEISVESKPGRTEFCVRLLQASP